MNRQTMDNEAPVNNNGNSFHGLLPAEQHKRILRKRHAAEFRFKMYGIAAVLVSILLLATLLLTIGVNGYSAFQQTYMKLDLTLDANDIPADDLAHANYQGVVKSSLRKMFPDVSGRRELRKLYSLVSSGAAFQLRDKVLDDPGLVGQTISLWVPADDDVDMYMKGHLDESVPADQRRLNPDQVEWINKLRAEDRIEKRFNTTLFTAGDSREPELAGIWGATVGSFYTLVVTLLLSFPIGVAAATYLEEFAPTNRWTDFIEVNINNLAAVPSIVFGLLGLAVFLNFFGLPRSAPLVGGLVLTLMTLPTIIISSRAAIKAVPPSIREAALGIGSSKMQTVLNHVLPLALPGILTGTIIGMAQALGETAPLLMIGMVAFIVDIPGGFTDPSTVLPVQIYLWSDSPERAFLERTSAAIMVLLAFLIAMNAVAILLRKRFERQW
ncbi:phosphate ABC transporter permease PstA [Oceanidesulfovibrio marinus]|uniref:Phosphate transport system permease protein PstA n=1 Tax=Oceanidesulfovibrio marinus TaxID=370038 RepID=A0A6P1ZL89_9BACT|nr:phosphate ABC transporter permease PstA [Oceanidesulfovibrio marinus]QJT07410.1 phosphate ABC transporter permease PstA [Oceanidesulfovibrio marinus]TVM34675.1 phosphate ABC transporter permease PtsA [Oceanidesulfovibrio marinus]